MSDEKKEYFDSYISIINKKIEALERTQKDYINAWDLRTKVQQDMEEQIAELREKLKLERKVKVWDAKVINRTNKQLTELKERVEGVYKSVHGIAPDQTDVITEVLRELCEIFQPSLLEKLDAGSARQTEKKELPIEKHLNERGKRFLKGLIKASGGEKEVHICVYCGGKLKYSHKFISEDEDRIYQFKCTKCGKISQTEHFNSFLGVMKASGGEKELPKRENGLNHSHGINSDTSVSDSKSPEPKIWWCKECGNEITKGEWILQESPQIIIEDRLPGGTGNEPREDEPKLCPICGKFLDGDKEWIDYAHSSIPVKREDLECLLESLENEYNQDIIHPFKEVYGIQ